MKIAVISKGDRLTGGASRVADDLARWLHEEGHAVTHFCRYFHPSPAPFQQHLGGPWVVRKIVQKLHGAGRRLGFPQVVPFEYFARLRWLRDSFDLFHFHDLSSAVSYETLVALSRHKPVVFTVHDCSAFTGGCIYPMGCEKFKTECGSCPQLGTRPLNTKFDHTRFMQRQRFRAAKQPGIQYVFPSQWIAQEALSVLSLHRPAMQLPYGIDSARMRSTPKTEARQKLGLPQDCPIILISAHHLLDKRKGVTHALEAVRRVADLSPILITMGQPDPSLESKVPGIPVVSFGFVEETEKMALIFSAADVFVIASLMDNSPLVIYEAMAAGTATVGFAAGGIPDLVVPGETGLLVPVMDDDALAAALRRVLSDRNLLQKWGTNARQRLEKHFSRRVFMEKHYALYRDFMQDFRK